MKSIHRFGNEFWVDGDWSRAAEVSCVDVHDHKTDTNTIRFEVNYGTCGGGPVDEVRPYADCIISACEFAKLCPSIYAGKTRGEIQQIWDDEMRVFYKGKYKVWERARRKARAREQAALEKRNVFRRPYP